MAGTEGNNVLSHGKSLVSTHLPLRDDTGRSPGFSHDRTNSMARLWQLLFFEHRCDLAAHVRAEHFVLFGPR